MWFFCFSLALSAISAQISFNLSISIILHMCDQVNLSETVWHVDHHPSSLQSRVWRCNANSSSISHQPSAFLPLPSSISHLTSFSFFPNLCQLPWPAVKLAKALKDPSLDPSMAICAGMSSGCLLYFILIHKKVPPWYAVLREAWWTLTVQIYNYSMKLTSLTPHF